MGKFKGVSSSFNPMENFGTGASKLSSEDLFAEWRSWHAVPAPNGLDSSYS